MSDKPISAMRRDYTLFTLGDHVVDNDPIEQFQQWFDEALQANIIEPNAMTLATVGPDGRPSARIVLLKDVSDEGFVFYTNYNSRKGSDLTITPYAVLVFYWAKHERQIRVEGRVHKTTPQESDKYFNSRPEGSRIGAIISPQSKAIPDRNFLEQAYADVEKTYQANHAPLQRPQNWGGYILVPDRVEFWQGRKNRLHDRIQYEKTSEGWKISRLAP